MGLDFSLSVLCAGFVSGIFIGYGAIILATMWTSVLKFFR